MRKSNWLILLTFGCSGVTLAAGLAVWLNFQTRSQAPVQLPAQGDDRTYAELALSLAARERYEDALAANARALSYNPANAALLYNQGWLESRLGRWQQALEFLARAQAQAPDDPEVRYTRVWVLQQLGRRKQWQNELKQAQRIKWQPTSAYARARLHQLAGEHPQAVKAFGQALSEQPKQGAGFYYARSQSLRILKQDTQALADLDRVIQWHPTAELYRERAAVHERLDQLEPALADLAHSQALDPRRETRLARARINLTLAPESSQQELEALLKEDPDWLPAVLLQVRAQLNARQLKPAQEGLSRLLTRHPNSGEGWWLQGVVYRVRRKYPEALNALAQARQHGYAPVEIELERARLAAQQGQQPEARLRLRKALQQQPELKQNLSEDRLLKKYIKSL